MINKKSSISPLIFNFLHKFLGKNLTCSYLRIYLYNTSRYIHEDAGRYTLFHKFEQYENRFWYNCYAASFVYYRQNKAVLKFVKRDYVIIIIIIVLWIRFFTFWKCIAHWSLLQWQSFAWNNDQDSASFLYAFQFD